MPIHDVDIIRLLGIVQEFILHPAFNLFSPQGINVAIGFSLVE